MSGFRVLVPMPEVERLTGAAALALERCVAGCCLEAASANECAISGQTLAEKSSISISNKEKEDEGWDEVGKSLGK